MDSMSCNLEASEASTTANEDVEPEVGDSQPVEQLENTVDCDVARLSEVTSSLRIGVDGGVADMFTGDSRVGADVVKFSMITHEITTAKPSFGPRDLSVPLQHRRWVMEGLRLLFAKREVNYENGSEMRTGYLLPVLVGIPGVGKSRLLNEYAQFVPKSSQPDRSIAVFVTYYNGFSISRSEKKMDVIFSFCGRILYRLFRSTDGETSLEAFLVQLFQKFGDNLRIGMIFRAVKAVLIEKQLIEPRSNLKVYIAVDEYQKIATDFGPHGLVTLADSILDASIELARNNIWLFPLFAGTEWDIIPGFGCANAFLKKITLPFLELSHSCRIAHAILANCIESKAFVRYLIKCGGIPRLCVEFTRDVALAGNMTVRNMDTAMKEATSQFSPKFGDITSSAVIIKIVARAICGDGCTPCSKAFESGMTWQQLANRGILQILDEQYVKVPFSLIMYCAGLYRRCIPERLCDEGSATELFLGCLANIIGLIDDTNLADWHKFEIFGAWFHAARINAFLVCGYQKVTLIQLFKGAKVDSKSVVILRPASVITSAEKIQTTTNLSCVAEHGNLANVNSAMDPTVCYIFVNGTNGMGVDIFFMLQTAQKRWLLLLDQRKVDNKTLTNGVLAALYARMPVPKLPDGSQPDVIGIVASAITHFGRRCNLAHNLVALSRSELAEYHGSLSVCASYFTSTCPNEANQTTLVQMLSLSCDVAKAVIKRAQEKHFILLSDFLKVIGPHYAQKITRDVSECLMLIDDVFADQDDDGNGEDGDDSGEDDVENDYAPWEETS
jgi:hypothetical protein